jgi:hypothetical protein
MKYLCLVYAEEKSMRTLSEPERDQLIDDSLSYDESLRRSGHFIVAHALQSVSTATTVRVRRSKPTITDGPFAETKEQLVGFILIEARDRDDALQAASKIPMARHGSIEVRPVRSLGPP